MSGPQRYLPSSYYQNLLTSEYKVSPNINAWLAGVCGYLTDLQTFLSSFTTQFDLADASGVQLDILGTIIGISRTVGFQPTAGGNPTLNDATYRILLSATIFQNQWDGTIGSFQAFWSKLFPGGNIGIQDNMNMTADIIVYGAFSQIILDLINNGYIVPRPQAVLYTYITPSNLPLLGLDANNSYIGGWDRGYIA